jgi:uncharacterized protein YhfF
MNVKNVKNVLRECLEERARYATVEEKLKLFRFKPDKSYRNHISYTQVLNGIQYCSCAGALITEEREGFNFALVVQIVLATTDDPSTILRLLTVH